MSPAVSIVSTGMSEASIFWLCSRLWSYIDISPSVSVERPSA